MDSLKEEKIFRSNIEVHVGCSSHLALAIVSRKNHLFIRARRVSSYVSRQVELMRQQRSEAEAAFTGRIPS